jgi:hypothetical protein
MARVRDSRKPATSRDSWTSAPGWVRATAAAALVTGIVAGWAGAGVSRFHPVALSTSEPAAVESPAAPAPAAEAVIEEPALPTTTPEAVPERSPEAAPAAPIVAGVTEKAGDTEEEELFDWDGDLADSYWEAVAGLSTSTSIPEAGETGETASDADGAGETGGARP